MKPLVETDGDSVSSPGALREGALSDYDHRVAYLLSVISTWCYGDAETLTKVLARKSIAVRAPQVRSYSVRNPALPVDANAFLISFDEGPHVLAFRGTEPTHLIDVLTDALVEQHIWHDRKDEWVHRGFFLSLDVLWPELVRDLSTLTGNLYITGHSLGGAIAVLAGRRFLDAGLETPLLRGVYTFGQPMVGGEVFAQRSHALNFHRHVYNRDVVAHLPPEGVGAGAFVHFGNLYVPSPAGGEQVWRLLENGNEKPTSCHLSDVLPSFLAPLVTRMQSKSVPLALAGFGLRALGMGITLSGFRDLLDLPRLLAGVELSFDDHIPTHYVDLSRASVSSSAHSKSATKRA